VQGVRLLHGSQNKTHQRRVPNRQMVNVINILSDTRLWGFSTSQNNKRLITETKNSFKLFYLLLL
jgi:hypothetical protein